MTPAAAAALMTRLAELSPFDRARVLHGLTPAERVMLREIWPAFAHDGQFAPDGDWRVWLIRAGRGFGKTRAGAEWVSDVARTNAEARIALIGLSIEDARKVMVEGPSGLLHVRRDDEDLKWRPSTGELEFPSGAVARIFSAAAPEKLRGPEHHAAWADELGAWPRVSAEPAWDNLMLTMRGGNDPRIVVTTTPRPTPLMRRIMGLKGKVETVGRSADNPHLPPTYLETMRAAYGRTRLGRQELDGELLDDAEGALWTRALIEARRVDRAPGLARVVIGVDPPAGIGRDACGIVAAAAARGPVRDRAFYVLEDASVVGASPSGWARAVAACAARWKADRVVAEGNQGGEMVRSTLEAADHKLPVKIVHATHGKVARAEPIATVFENGRAWFAGAFPALEDELCGLSAGGDYSGPGRSPDRADAMVWAMTALVEGRKGEAGVRGL